MKLRQILFIFIMLVIVNCKSFRQQCTPPTDYAYHIDNTEDPTGKTKKMKGPKTDKAWEFDGNGYRSLGAINLANDITVAFWATWYSLPNYSKVVSLGDTANNPDYMIYNKGTTNELEISRRKSTEPGYTVSIPGVINGYYYNHYTVIFHANGEITVYINGIDQASKLKKNGTPGSYNIGNNRKGYVGRSHWDPNGDPKFNGAVDEFMIFNRVLNQQEIDCLNDYCDSTCFSTCKKRSDNCDAAAKEHTDGNSNTCPVPKNPLYSFENLDTGYTTTGTITKTTGPVTDKALVFNGQSWTKFKYSDIYGGEMSFAIWVRWDSLKTWSRIFDFGGGDSVVNIILSNVSTGRQVEFSLRDPTKKINKVNQENGVEVGKWHHYITTIDRQGNLKLYIDGKSVGNASKQFNAGVDYVYRANSYIGKSNWNADQIFNGAMDDFQVYGRVLKPEEILCLAKKCAIKCTNGAAWCAHNSKFCKLDNCVEIFSECEYRGTKQTICKDNPKLDPQEVRSIKVPSGYMLRLYSTIDYGAQMAEFKADQSCLQSIPFKDNVNKVLLSINEEEQDFDELQKNDL